jgi:hypothetical protein
VNPSQVVPTAAPLPSTHLPVDVHKAEQQIMPVEEVETSEIAAAEDPDAAATRTQGTILRVAHPI